MSSKVISGRYELLEKIGVGGMAVVYKAKDRLLNRAVAIKILKPEFTKDAKFIRISDGNLMRQQACRILIL